MKYRVGGPDNWPAVTQLLADSGYFGIVDAAALADSGFWYLALLDGEVVACVWCTRGRDVYIDYLYVRPDVKGAGPRLIARLRKILVTLGARTVRFTVRSDNEEAQRLFRAFGCALHEGYTMGALYLGDSHGI